MQSQQSDNDILSRWDWASTIILISNKEK